MAERSRHETIDIKELLDLDVEEIRAHNVQRIVTYKAEGVPMRSFIRCSLMDMGFSGEDLGHECKKMKSDFGSEWEDEEYEEELVDGTPGT